MDDYEHPTVKRLRRRTLAKITIGAEHDAPQTESLEDFLERFKREREERRKEKDNDQA